MFDDPKWLMKLIKLLLEKEKLWIGMLLTQHKGMNAVPMIGDVKNEGKRENK